MSVQGRWPPEYTLSAHNIDKGLPSTPPSNPPTPHTPPSLPLRGFLPACHCESPLPVSNCHPADRGCCTDKKEQQLEFTAHSSDTFPRLLCVWEVTTPRLLWVYGVTIPSSLSIWGNYPRLLWVYGVTTPAFLCIWGNYPSLFVYMG